MSLSPVTPPIYAPTTYTPPTPPPSYQPPPANQQYQQQYQQHQPGWMRGGRGRGRGRGTCQGRGSGGRHFDRPMTYCWTHGNYYHNSGTCINTSHGHQQAATFHNRLGVNDRNCAWQIRMDVQHIDNKNKNQLVQSLIPPHFIKSKADSGASNHYWWPQDVDALSNIESTTTGPKVKLPNNRIIQANKTGIINLPKKVSTKGATAHVLPNLQNASLISLGHFADDNCITVLEDNTINIYKKSDPSKGELNYAKHLQPKNKILSGPRNLKDGLWDLHIPSTSNAASNQSTLHQANAITRKDKSKTELAQYLHAAAGYPVLSTFIQASKKGNFLSWPGIESISFKKHLPKPMATEKVHLY